MWPKRGQFWGAFFKGYLCGVGVPLILGVPVHPKRMIAGPEKLGLQVVLCCYVVDPMQDAMAGSDTCHVPLNSLKDGSWLHVGVL